MNTNLAIFDPGDLMRSDWLEELGESHALLRFAEVEAVIHSMLGSVPEAIIVTADANGFDKAREGFDRLLIRATKKRSCSSSGGS